MADKSAIEKIKSLKDRTGCGMMDCKRALEENGYDEEKAIDYLREKGMAKQAKRASRTAAEGLIGLKECKECGKAAMVEVNCETDFVSGSDKFQAFAKESVEAVLKNEPASLEEAQGLVSQVLADTAMAVGEKTEFRRYVVLKPVEGGVLGTYLHVVDGRAKIGVIVSMEKADEELAKQIAMHIAANNPIYIDLADVPAADRERETNIAKAEVADDPKLAGKPEQVLAGIVQRKVDKSLSVSCLYLQKWLFDESKTVGQAVQEKGNKVLSSVRYQVGEGIVRDPNQEA